MILTFLIWVTELLAHAADTVHRYVMNVTLWLRKWAWRAHFGCHVFIPNNSEEPKPWWMRIVRYRPAWLERRRQAQLARERQAAKEAAK